LIPYVAGDPDSRRSELRACLRVKGAEKTILGVKTAVCIRGACGKMRYCRIQLPCLSTNRNP
jgi:hypothetical protein